ncbi:hypothetical protein QYH69_13305 [Paraburkholderia sp. SARCC-3016]|uniref:hypothetical protein n=1 Tax=Paraburkholderia sp. SARCC-3016 TaxID=3058611 RepID=UPI002809928B|nr:hypothetical protein [Paraburkholderia sp. SARCC-3016]MDQ7978222.1 hypothetical protein [Paraburkholderia sp. SARCC-3016]
MNSEQTENTGYSESLGKLNFFSSVLADKNQDYSTTILMRAKCDESSSTTGREKEARGMT